MIHNVRHLFAAAVCIWSLTGLVYGDEMADDRLSAASEDGPAPKKSARKGDSHTKAELADFKDAFAKLRTSPAEAAEHASLILERHPQLPEKLRAHTLWIKGSGLSLSEQHPEALTALTSAEEIFRRVKEQKMLRQTLRYIAASAFECGEYEMGRRAAAEAVLMSSEWNDRSAYVSVLYNELALNEIELGQTTSAIENLRLAIDISRSCGDEKGHVKSLINLGNLLCENGFQAKAAECFREVIETEEGKTVSFPLVAAHAGLGDVLVASRELVKSRRHLQQALDLCRQPGTDNIRAAVELSLGRWEVAADNPTMAEQHFSRSLELYTQLNNPGGVTSASQHLRRLQSAQDIQAIREQLRVARESGGCGEELSLLYELADLLRQSDQWQEATDQLARAAELERDRGRENLTARIDSELALMDQDALRHLQTEVESKLEQLQSQEWWYTGLAVSVVGLLLTLGFVVRLLYDKKAAVHALREAHSQLEGQKVVQLKMERQLARQQKSQSLESMASGIAHDFNNLLTGIAGLAELAVRAGSSTEKDELLQQITSTSIEASGLTGQLRQFLGQPSPQDVQCDASVVLHNTSRLLESLCRPRQLTINTAESQLATRIDATRLQQVLVNLVSNASEATSSDGRIDLQICNVTCDQSTLNAHQCEPTVTPGQFRRVDVIDNGHGLTEADRARIFDPYFSTKGVGRGLGLSSVAGIVRSAGGFVTVAAGPAGGTWLSVFLPAAESESVCVSQTESSEPRETVRQHHARVLIVDDERLILDLQKMSLTQAGMNVTTAESAEAALQLATEHGFGFDCVITDYSMPGHNGRWLARQIRTQAPDLPVILCSGFADESMEPGRDISVVLSKPYTQKDLMDAIAACVSHLPVRDSVVA
ncbi:MAG: response regulator [Planctomycetaceae bacterium]|nr:response regulator [Planctomycetaceae bacterium]